MSDFIATVGQQPTSGEYARAHRRQIRDSGGRFAGGWGVAWQGLSDIDDNVYEYVDDLLNRVRINAEELVDEIVQYMQSHAPWSDQTGNARRGLQGQVVWHDETHFTIMLGHGADIEYGIWLEVKDGGKFAIVAPTARLFGPLIGGKLTGAR